MRKVLTFVTVILLASPLWAQQPRLIINLNQLLPGHRDARTEARIAVWESPMGRLRYAVAELQGTAYVRGTPHTPTQGLIGVKAQKGTRARLVTAALQSGIQVSESSVAVVRWPWQSKAQGQPSVLPLDQQLSILLGRRLQER